MLGTLFAAVSALALISCGGGGAPSAPDASVPAQAVLASARGNVPTGLVAGEVSVVNSVTAGDQTLRTIGATSDGGSVVVWQSPGPTLLLQVYGDAGEKSGPPVVIPIDIGAATATAAARAIEQSSVAVLSDGSVVVLYRVARLVELGGGLVQSVTGLYFQRFGVNGVQLTPETQVVAQPDAGPKSPFIAQAGAVPLSDGGFTVAWTVAHFAVQFNSISTLSMRWFDGEGQPAGSPTEVGTFPELIYTVVADLHGGLALTLVRTDNFYGRDSEVLHYDASHTFVEVVTPTLRTILLLPLEDADLLFAGDGSGATEQLLDRQGVPLGAAQPVASVPLAARELADGTYVTLRSAGNGAFTLEWFAADMTPLAAPLTIANRGVLPQLAPLADPAFAVAWTGPSANTGTDVYAQRFEESSNGAKKACLNSAREHHLTGRARKSFMEVCASRA